MTRLQLTSAIALSAMLLAAASAQSRRSRRLNSRRHPRPHGQGAPPVKAGSQTFNTVITKLKEGKQIFSNTIIGPDLDVAKKACEGRRLHLDRDAAQHAHLA